jgi:IclR family acetate operon transcriptional repressor
MARVRRRAPARTASRSPAAAAPDKYFSKVVGKALDALDRIRAANGPVSLNDLTLQIGLAKTSLFRILHTLEVAGYLERDPDGRYRAPAALRPHSTAALQPDLLRAAQPLMKALNREFRETVTLALLFENHVEVIATLDSPQLIRMGNTVGRILPPHASSLGKAITAFQSEERRDSLLRSYGLHRFTDHTIVQDLDLKREFERIRQSGYSLDAEESALGGCCFGAPIRGGGRDVIGAISLSMPKMRLAASEDLHDRILAAVRAAAHDISAQLQSSASR